MEIYRTPEECFEGLPGYSFEPHYFQAGPLRMHYVDEGKGDEVVLLLHGEPSWSYLYRKMIGPLADNGYRVIAPDLIGFGKSDKPAFQEDYTYQKHVNWMESFLLGLNLKNITLFCQDWGGLIGLRLVAVHSERFKRVIAANTILPTGDVPPNEAFLKWRKFSRESPEFDVGRIIQRATVSELDEEVIKAYNAPFPEEKYKAGARIFPSLVPIRPDDPASEPNRRALQSLSRFDKPFLTAFSDSDPITRGLDKFFQSVVPGARQQKHVVIERAGHFLQEDKGEELAQVVHQFITDNP